MNKRELKRWVHERIEKQKDAVVLATVDERGAPQMRYMSIVKVERSALWFSTFANSRKVKQLRKCSKAQVIFGFDKNEHVTISGKAEVVLDKRKKKHLWDQAPFDLGNYFKSPDDPLYALIKIPFDMIELMSFKHGRQCWEKTKGKRKKY